MPTAPNVCALGWVKYREHISLLVILCIIVYVTKKKKKTLDILMLIVNISVADDAFYKYNVFIVVILR